MRTDPARIGALCAALLTLTLAACEESPTASESPVDPAIAFGKGNGNGGGGPGGGGGCSNIGLQLSFDDALAGFSSDGAGAYEDGVQGVAAEIQCDGNFDLYLRNGLKRKDPTIRFVETHVVSIDSSFADVGPGPEETRFKSGNEFDLYALPPDSTTTVGLSVTWETADGIRYQIRYGDALGGDDCGSSWDDPSRYVTVSRSADGSSWAIEGQEGLLCVLDPDSGQTTPQPVGIGLAPFRIDADQN